MTDKEVLEQLKGLGTPQNRSAYADFGVKGKLFGVSFGNLAKLARSIGIDQPLAEALWASKNHDARMLATMIADARAISSDTLDAWTKGLDNHILAESFSALVARSPAARLCVRDWIKSRREVVATAAWGLVAQLARRDGELEPSMAGELLVVLEKKIASSPDKARAAMNSALIAIGTYVSELEQEALDVAGRIGTLPSGSDGAPPLPDAASAITNNAGYHRSKTTRLNPEAEREYAKKRVSLSDPLPIPKRKPKPKPKPILPKKTKSSEPTEAASKKAPAKKAAATKKKVTKKATTGSASAKKKATKKAATKASATKKKVTKKAASAEAPAKKKTAKKAPPAKKATTKKATTKKAATKKKVTKKAAAKAPATKKKAKKKKA